MANVDGFMFYVGYWNSISDILDDEDLTDKQRMKISNELFIGICRYVFDGELPTFKGTAKSVFSAIRHNLDTSISRSKSGQKKNKQETKQEQKENKQETSDEQGKKKEKRNEHEDEKERKEERKSPLTNSYTIQDIISLCETASPVIHSRHLSNPSADYNLGQILNELQNQISLEDIRKLLEHANQTYMVYPKWKNHNLVWVLNNQCKVWDAEVVGGARTPSQEPQEDFDYGGRDL